MSKQTRPAWDGSGEDIVRGDCFVCDQRGEHVLVVERFDGSTYDVPMCSACLTETSLRSSGIRLAHELIDVRNDYRARLASFVKTTEDSGQKHESAAGASKIPRVGAHVTLVTSGGPR